LTEIFIKILTEILTKFVTKTLTEILVYNRKLLFLLQYFGHNLRTKPFDKKKSKNFKQFLKKNQNFLTKNNTLEFWTTIKIFDKHLALAQ